MGRFIATSGGGSLEFPIMNLGWDQAVFVLWLGSRSGMTTMFVFVVRIRLCLCLCL